jgi:hypothetical protein
LGSFIFVLPPSRQLLAAAVCLVLLIVTPAQAGASPDQLLARYQPVAVLDPVEPFQPVAVNGFLAAARLEQRSPSGTWIDSGLPTSPLPTMDPIGCTGTASSACWRLDLPGCTVAVGVASIACYQELVRAHPGPHVVYGAVLRSRIALQYWYWYWADFWSGTRPATDYVWQAHEGDWEVVSVILARSGKPLLVGYSQHGCGKRRAWNAVPKWRRTTHPIAYVALGSHANYFSAGIDQLDLRQQCYPPVGAAILRHFLPEVLEYTGHGARFGPRLRGVTPASIVRIAPSSPQWMAFHGYWDETNLFHAPDPIGTREAGPGPAGPRFHALWNDPVGTVLGWPRG